VRWRWCLLGGFSAAATFADPPERSSDRITGVLSPDDVFFAFCDVDGLRAKANSTDSKGPITVR
jgi:hypothetical protein